MAVCVCVCRHWRAVSLPHGPWALARPCGPTVPPQSHPHLTQARPRPHLHRLPYALRVCVCLCVCVCGSVWMGESYACVCVAPPQCQCPRCRPLPSAPAVWMMSRYHRFHRWLLFPCLEYISRYIYVCVCVSLSLSPSLCSVAPPPVWVGMCPPLTFPLSPMKLCSKRSACCTRRPQTIWPHSYGYPPPPFHPVCVCVCECVCC